MAEKELSETVIELYRQLVKEEGLSVAQAMTEAARLAQWIGQKGKFNPVTNDWRVPDEQSEQK